MPDPGLPMTTDPSSSTPPSHEVLGEAARVSSQKSVEESLQLSIYALACRDALRLGTPEKVTLYFTETGTHMSTTRSDQQLDAARDHLAARVLAALTT